MYSKGLDLSVNMFWNGYLLKYPMGNLDAIYEMP